MRDNRGNVVEWSPGAEKLIGVSAEQVRGYGIAFLLPKDMWHEHRDAFESAVIRNGLSNHKRVQQVECPIVIHGDQREAIITVRPTKHEGRIAFMATIDLASTVEKVQP